VLEIAEKDVEELKPAPLMAMPYLREWQEHVVYLGLFCWLDKQSC